MTFQVLSKYMRHRAKDFKQVQHLQGFCELTLVLTVFGSVRTSSGVFTNALSQLRQKAPYLFCY